MKKHICLMLTLILLLLPLSCLSACGDNPESTGNADNTENGTAAGGAPTDPPPTDPPTEKPTAPPVFAEKLKYDPADGWMIQDFSAPVSNDDPLWKTYGANCFVENGAFVYDFDTTTTYGLQVLTPYEGGGVTRLDFDLKSDAYRCDANPWMTLFIGLRLPKSATTTDGGTRLWFTFKGDEIGIRAEDWPAVECFPLPFDFDEGFTRVYIEDDTREGMNEIRIYADNSKFDGQKTMIFKLVIGGDDKTAELYTYRNGFETSELTLEGAAIPKSGYAGFWIHHAFGYEIANVAFNADMKE